SLAQLVKRSRVVGIELGRNLEFGNRMIDVALLQKQLSEFRVRAGELWIQAYGLLKCAYRFFDCRGTRFRAGANQRFRKNVGKQKISLRKLALFSQHI